MEENDLILLIVDKENAAENSENEIKQEIVDENDSDYIEDLMEAAHRHGTVISMGELGTCSDLNDDVTDDIKDSLGSDNNYDYDIDIKEEPIGGEDIEFVGDCLNDSYSEIDYLEEKSEVKLHHSQRLKDNYVSFVAQLEKDNPEFAKDKLKLVEKLSEIMLSIKCEPPKPPKNFFSIVNSEYKCTKCPTRKDTVGNLERHYQVKHGPRYLICFACGDDFRCAGNLYRHEKRCKAPDAEYVVKARKVMLVPKGRKKKLRKPRKAKEPKPQDYPCSLCAAVFKSKKGLEYHESLHRGERKFSCHMCVAAYTTAGALRRHLKSHMDSEFICDICKKGFQIKNLLIDHMRMHLYNLPPTRKYPCTYKGCPRSYNQRCYLEVHLNCFHRKLPLPCACTVCPRRFSRNSRLREHMKKEHGLTLMTKRMFFKSLPRLSSTQVDKAKVIFSEDFSNNYKFFTPKEETKKDVEEKIEKVEVIINEEPIDESHIYGTVVKEEIVDDS